MSFHVGTRSMLLGLAALLASASACGARSELVTGGYEACADGSSAGAVGCSSVAFADAVSYPVGAGPKFELVVVDLNGDGLLDIATANTRADSVSVLSNLGDGTFGPPVTHGPVRLPTSIAVADLDRDGRLDLAVTSAETSGLSVFLNAGGGTFADPISYLLPPHTMLDDLAVGDVSGDGWPDFVYERGVGVEVRLNNADDTIFGDAASYPQTQFVATALGDLNGDCRLDLALVDYDKTVSVMPNLGDGTFGPATMHVVGSKPATSVAVGDLDGDGKLDLVVSYGETGLVSVLLNRGCAP